MTHLNYAYKVLHYKEITQIAIKKYGLKPIGSTPEATMHAVIGQDLKKSNSQFVKTGPATFGLKQQAMKVKTFSKKTDAGKNLNRYSKKPKISKLSRKPKKMTEDFVQSAIITYFANNDWKIKTFATKTEKGVDLKFSRHRSSKYFLIETKGQTKANERNDLCVALGQIITRMKIKDFKRYKFGLGFPDSIVKKPVLRLLPWSVAQKLKLFIFSVDSDKNVKEYRWQELKELQT